MKKFKSLILLAALVLIITCLLPACSKNESPPQKPKSSAGEKPAAPPAAESILSDLDKIIEEIDKMIKMPKMAYLQQPDEKEDPQSSPDKTNEQSSENSNSSKKSSPSSSGDWQKITAGIKNLHNNWNTLEPEAVKAGLTIGSRDNFEQTLNLLTIQASKQNTTESLMAAITLYKYYADLAQVFAMPIPPEFFRVKYEAMSAIGEAVRNEWEIARQHIPRLQDIGKT